MEIYPPDLGVLKKYVTKNYGGWTNNNKKQILN